MPLPLEEQFVLYRAFASAEQKPLFDPEKPDMSAASKRLRAAPIAVPRFPLSAIVVFAVAGVGGSFFLAYTNSLSSADSIQTGAAVNGNVPVYAVRAVPFDPPPASVAARANAGVQTGAGTQAEPGPARTDEPGGDAASAEPRLFAETSHEFKGFNRFSDFGGASNQLTITSTTFGILASTAPSYIAPDAEGISAPVPESSTGWCAAALLVLLLARALYASWHRNHRRAGNKTNSARP